MATITSSGTGNWTATVADAPWPGGTVPGTGDLAIVDSGDNVTLTASVATGSIKVDGTLTGGGY